MEFTASAPAGARATTAMSSTSQAGTISLAHLAASPPAGADSFFPIHVFFSSPRTLCQLDTNGVFSSESGAAVPFHKHSLLAVESYTIV
eukprot:scaffold207776_cov32-Tisochrysis_lutea.AAC.7